MSKQYSIVWYSMKVTVKPNKKEFKINKIDNNEYIIETTSRAIENRCNEEIVKELAKYFHTEQALVKIVKGNHNRHKYLKIGIRESNTSI